MAEVEVDEVEADSDGYDGQRLGEESGWGGAADALRDKADKAMEEHLLDVAKCILDNVRDMHLPSVNLLFEIAARVKTTNDVPEEQYLSLAQVLWKARQEQDEEPGTRE